MENTLLFGFRLAGGFILAVAVVFCFVTPSVSTFTFTGLSGMMYAVALFIDWKYLTPAGDGSTTLATGSAPALVVPAEDEPASSEAVPAARKDLGPVRPQRMVPRQRSRTH